MVWTILRIVLGIYLLIGFFVYLKSDNRALAASDRPEGEKQNNKQVVLKIIQTILLWPGFLKRGPKN